MPIKTLIITLLLIPTLSACATQRNTDGYAVYDPAEKANRGVFRFNQGADKYALRPVAKSYGKLPSRFRLGVRNFLQNLGEPFSAANQLLQADFEGAATGVGRFAINTTLGLAGIIDVANKRFNLEREEEDFGQTLAVWGVSDGPYVTLPIFGPSNVRDTVGIVAEIFLDPVDILVDDVAFEITTNAVDGIDQREQLDGTLEDLERNSLDYYSALKSAYKQNRDKRISE